MQNIVLLTLIIYHAGQEKGTNNKMENKNTNRQKGLAYTQPEHIKPKSKWTKKTTVWTIVIAVIVLGILAIIGANQGWFKTQDMINGKIELGDYSNIEIADTDVEVTDSNVESFLDSVISYGTTSEQITEGTVEDGDTINLDYTGVLKGQDEPFEGGSAQGTSLTLGSGRMIEGFESQIAGHEIGETFDIDVTFPEDYSTEDLAGQDATFTITINSKTQTNVPEMSDELAQEYSAANLDETFDTVDALTDYYRDRTYNSRLESAIMTDLRNKSTVKYYNEANLAALTSYNESSLAYYASQFGTDVSTMASMYGYDSAREYAEATSKDTLQQTMIIDKVAEEQGISYTEEEYNEVIQRYMDNEAYTGTMEDFVAQADPAALYLITETEVLMPKVMDYLKGNVTIIETPEEETEAAAEDVTAAEPVSEEPAQETVEETEAVTEAAAETES